MANILTIIPARGGSKGIPRKNVRTLGKFPLIYYSINVALSTKFDQDVYVSTDDDEIATLATRFGAKVIFRNPNLGKDAVTLDPVIFEAYEKAQKIEGKNYDLIITLQPTSPLLKSTSVDAAIQKMLDNSDTETILAAVNDTHLTWSEKDGKFVPNYTARVNRQYLTPVYKETGGFLITRNTIISENNRIGKEVALHTLQGAESIDIDNYSDWNLCAYYLTLKKIVFVVSGYKEIGLGHVYNTLVLANEILNHELIFLVDKKSQLAFDVISTYNYPVLMQEEDSIVDDLAKLKPEIVINDRLDTSKDYMEGLKRIGLKAINIEDLGEGAKHADLVINAMYPEREALPNHYFGHRYFCLRNEFIHTNKAEVDIPKVTKILLSFGGVDPNNLTKKVLRSVYEFCLQENIEITVIVGMGYKKVDSLSDFKEVEIHTNVPNISDYMSQAHIAFTSAGRTTFELSSIGVPTIVLAQNIRETTHFYAYPNYGFINMGLGASCEENDILNTFKELVFDKEKRMFMSQLMMDNDLLGGKKRVMDLIHQLINS